MQVSAASSSTCPSQLAPIDQTSYICTKLTNAQVGCVTNVDSYSLYACTYVASVRDISKIVCYHQVLFAAVTKLQQFEEKTTNIFAASGFHKISRIIYCARYWKLPVYTECSQFNHYVGLVNLPFRHLAICSPTARYITLHVFESLLRTCQHQRRRPRRITSSIGARCCIRRLSSFRM